MKYIIDIEDEYAKDWVNDTPMCKELCMPISVPNRQRTYHVTTGFKLEPYTEPDRKAIEDEVWELADYMCKMSPTERTLCFAFEYPSEVTTNFTYQEAKALFEKWMKSEHEIKVGDEVEYEDCKFIVTAEIGNKYHGIHSSNGDIVSFGEGDYCRKDNCKKTGRHFDEVEKLLEKMRGAEE